MVVPLTSANLSDFVRTERMVLVEFYSPTCAKCKQLEPELEAAATEIKGTGMHVAKVDVIKEEALAKQYGIETWPTLKLFLK